MAVIQVLDKNTIDKIAAGEVIERPSSVVKELAENAVDAGASSITIEIRDGGISFLRVTDNGSGIASDQVQTAFLRHSTSKIRNVKDLAHISSLGFRGEALSSIAAVAQVELITKTKDQDAGTLYRIEGGEEKGMEETGAPEGTTFLIRNLFYNVPARKKFLKSAMTEAGYVGSLVERLSLSHPEIAFKLIVNHQTKLQTSGNSNLKDIIYNIYGRDVASALLPVSFDDGAVRVSGFIGKPVVSRGNRNYENYFVNGRYIKNPVITKAIEDAYKSHMMQHRYPFAALLLEVDGEKMDVNVHPAKLEVRFSENDKIYQGIHGAVQDALTGKEFIPEIVMNQERPSAGGIVPSAMRESPVYETRMREQTGILNQEVSLPLSLSSSVISRPPTDHSVDDVREKNLGYFMEKMRERVTREFQEEKKPAQEEKKPVEKTEQTEKTEQLELFQHRFLDERSLADYRIIGQLFDTYWLIQFEDKLYIIDQHAAHEKVLYERIMKTLRNREFTSQLLSPPVILTLNMQEENLLNSYMENFTELGFQIEPFGGREYAVRAVPANLFSLASKDIFTEMLDSLGAAGTDARAEMINDRIATMSCKAAVKGNDRLSKAEAEALIDELLQLENPYNCPHGRPTIVSMSRYELEKKFKRIV